MTEAALQDNTGIDKVWDTLSVEERAGFLNSVLVRLKEDLDTISGYMTVDEKLFANMELSYLLGLLEGVESNAGIEKVIVRLAGVESVFEAQYTQRLQKMLKEQVDQIERGLTFSNGIIPPDDMIAIRQSLDISRKTLAISDKRDDLEPILLALEDARDKMSGKSRMN